MSTIFFAALGLALLGAAAWFGPRLAAGLIDRRIAAFQNDLMGKHVTEVENIYRQMRGWRHDYHNHIQAMQAHLALGQHAELREYMAHLNDDLVNVDTVLKTGNVMVDAILNSKISLALSKKIDVNAKAAVPKELPVSEIDLCVILGNLMDNAIESCARVERGGFIRVYLGRHREMLYLSVQNARAGEIRKSGKAYLSTKPGEHGFGLARVDRIVTRYNGFVNRQHEEGVFATEVMLPL